MHLKVQIKNRLQAWRSAWPPGRERVLHFQLSWPVFTGLALLLHVLAFWLMQSWSHQGAQSDGDSPISIEAVLLDASDDATPTPPNKRTTPTPPKPHQPQQPLPEPAPKPQALVTTPLVTPKVQPEQAEVPVPQASPQAPSAPSPPSPETPETKNTTAPNTAALSNKTGAPSAAAPALEWPSSDASYLNNPKPIYPAKSKRLGEQGTVVLRVLIDIDGRAADAQIARSSGHALLDQAALDTVKRWRYAPGKRQGVPQAMWFQIPIHFVLEQ